MKLFHHASGAASLLLLVASAVFFVPASSFTTTPMVTSRTGIFAGHSKTTAMWARNDGMLGGEQEPVEETSNKVTQRKTSTDPTPVLFSAIQELVKNNPAVTMASAAMVLLLAFSPLSADAAMSGGRMGGSFSAPRQSYSRTMPSRGYSSGGYYSRPSVIVAPTIAPYYSPFYNPFPRPFFFGSPGVISYSRGPSLFDLVLFGGIAFTIANAFRGAASGVESSFGGMAFGEATSALGSGTSVVQVTVALNVANRDDRNSILSVLDRLAQTSQTDRRVGIQNLTSQVALELLRRKSSIVSASTRYEHYSSREKAQRDFTNLSVKERSKFEQETVSKYGGVDYGSQKSSRSLSVDQGAGATVAVVTLILAIDGDSTKVPKINSVSDVEDALRKIASDAKVADCLQSAEILWTPEDRSETLTFRDVVADYPELRAV